MLKTKSGQAELRTLISAVLRDAVSTRADSVSPITANDDSGADAWQQAIDYQLVEWGRDPDALADEGIDPPARAVIARAIEWARRWRDLGTEPPTRVTTDPNGGVIFERRVGNITGIVHFWVDGSVEVRQFQGTRPILRRELQPPTGVQE
jgi:hypothetical protein